MAEEVHGIFPEGADNLARIAKDPAHLFFKKYGESMPAGAWNDPGTKQGIYMMGPEAEYLEGGGAISGGIDDVRRRLRTALDRWAELRKKKKYANEPVPETDNVAVPDVAGKPLVLRAFSRDLPRGPGDRSGRRFTKADFRGIWPDYVKWAWNINWIGFDDPSVLVPSGTSEEMVRPEVVRRLCRQVLVDNVRGESGRWADSSVKLAELAMRSIESDTTRFVIEYRGRAKLESWHQKYEPRLYGRGVWNFEAKRFDELEIVAIGQRTGAGPLNRRKQDRGPAPMGVALILHEAATETKR